MQTLRELIETRGVQAVADDLGLTPSYVRQLRSGAKPVSAEVLALAEAKYGDALNLRSTLREMRPGAYAQAPKRKMGQRRRGVNDAVTSSDCSDHGVGVTHE